MKNSLIKQSWIIVICLVWVTAVACNPTHLQPVTTARVATTTPPINQPTTTIDPFATSPIVESPAIIPIATATRTTAIISPTEIIMPTLEANAVGFSVAPQLEELLDCVSTAWWAEEGQAIYFVKCPTFNGPQEGLWRLDLTTRTVTQIGETPVRPRVPAHLQSLVPDSVRDVFVHLSPSGERIIYLEQLDPYLNQPTPTPVANSADLGELPIRFEYLVYFIDQDGETVNLGQIEGTPFEISWSRDERLAFMPTTLMDGDVPGGWLVDLKKLTLQEMTPPTYDGSAISLHFCLASLQPNGEAILYRQCFIESAPFLLWNYRTGDIQEIENYGPFYIWLSGNHDLLFSNNKALVWYTFVTGQTVTIMPDANAFFGLAQNIQYLSPQGDRVIFRRIQNSVPQGLWMMTFEAK